MAKRNRDPQLAARRPSQGPPEEVAYDEARQLVIGDGNTVWIPEDATALQQ
ncbi:hypothetical protein PF005_g8191 [Phytophthora fragariae]|uniref:Uncharacterized protein n=1 Tax=Phytophthora fragariae TaxID=53985 RepID=A0A6A4CUB8_9STRA|nr:hypothetical protein PF003_g17818 [Phytophthora fragariae]KAE9004030.1 hypothetical protein PF011_g12636 [Phytophthora fragariae]KAE9104897.1 hypothetical protein PF010_g13218 [Phytophthora fragariae]KAE9129199.1 hypothetical protein PF006_g16085 [Phytophthora fragariae]KAE9218607.1 hypothetical protein PF005_g8191 [Phytophthora fragariae]